MLVGQFFVMLKTTTYADDEFAKIKLRATLVFLQYLKVFSRWQFFGSKNSLTALAGTPSPY